MFVFVRGWFARRLSSDDGCTDRHGVDVITGVVGMFDSRAPGRSQGLQEVSLQVVQIDRARRRAQAVATHERAALLPA